MTIRELCSRAGWRSLGAGPLLCVLITLAISTRALPLAISCLPFNNDGITEARIASDILRTGSLDYPEGSWYIGGHNVITPAYNVLLAFLSASVGSSPYVVAQYAISIISVLTVVGIYIVGLLISRSHKGALMAAMVLSLSGTFVFLTGSTWKLSLGVALLVLMVYAHMNRSDRRMLALEIVLLSTLMIVHHLAAILTYLAIAYSTGISTATSLQRMRLGLENKVDIVVISTISICAVLYYRYTALDRYSSVVDGNGWFILIGLFATILVAAILVVRQEKHSRLTFAPVPSIVIAALFVWEYYSPFFPYVGGFPIYVLLLGTVTAIVLGFAWYGFESAIMSDSRFKAIPLIWLLPVMTLLLYAVAVGPTLSSHQIIYRSFDFGYVSVAMGISFTVASVARKPRYEIAAITSIVLLVLVTFPFGYVTGTLEGIRHDSQQYELDALTWVHACEGPDAIIQSDERISYNGLALYDFIKRPHVPEYLMQQTFPSVLTLNLYLEEWAAIGVNCYPYGYIVINQENASVALSASNVLYVGGPADNNVIIFRSSEVGQAILISSQ